MKTRITALILIAICTTINLWKLDVCLFIAIRYYTASIEICNTGHGNNNWPKELRLLRSATILMVFIMLKLFPQQ